MKALTGLVLLMLAWPVAAQDAKQLDREVSRAKRAGDFPAALAAAEQILELRRAEVDAPAYRAAQALAQVQSLQAIVALDSAAWDSLRVAEELHTQVYNHYRNGDHVASAAAARRQLALRRAVLPTPHFDLTVSLSWLSLALRNQGDFAAAEAASREALRQFLALYGREHVHTATGVNALADLLRQRGQLLEAEVLLREALVLRRRLFGDDNFVLAGSHNNLANVLGAQGQYAEAAEHFQASLALVRRYRGERHRLVATGLRNLAVVLQAQGELDDAAVALREAIGIYTEAGNASGVARSQRWLAHVLFAKGDLPGAEAMYRECLTGFLAEHGEQHDWVAATRGGLGRVLARDGRLDDAQAELEAALAIQLNLFGRNHASTVETQVELARLHWTRDEPAPALGLLDDAAAAFEVARTQAAGDWKRATVRITSPYLLRAAVLRSLDRDAEAWAAADRARARTLSELIDRGGLRQLDDAARATEEELRLRLAAAAAEVGELRDGDVEPSRLQAAVDRELEVQLSWSRWQRDRVDAHATGAERAVNVAQVQAALGPDEALVGYLSVDDAKGVRHRWASVVRPAGLTWVDLPAVTAPLEPFARQLAGEGSSALGLRLDDTFLRQAKRAYAYWVQPLVEHLDGVRAITVVPGEELVGIPLEALVDEAYVPVGQRFVVHYVPSAALSLRGGGSARERPTTAFLLGDPPFGGEFAPLPHTRTEIEAAAAFFSNTETLVGADANEPAIWELVRSGRMREFDVIHLATHAIPDAMRPEDSSLILAAPESGAFDAVVEARPAFDGRITVAEILASWKLSADLVTLSACATGLGRRVQGEGYMGLAHAFFHAGSRSLLVSLWEVDDEATSMLMRRFYSNLATQSKAEALQDARAFLAQHQDGAGRRPFEHPHYWAAFVLVGDG